MDGAAVLAHSHWIMSVEEIKKKQKERKKQMSGSAHYLAAMKDFGAAPLAAMGYSSMVGNLK